MKQLWAPWRKVYTQPESRNKGCFFCRLLAQKKDARDYILKRTPFNFALLNLYPYNTGHVLVAPLRHVDTTDKLMDAEKLDWLELYEEIKNAITKVMKPQGFNVGINLGESAGAGVPGHLHLHVVPRWDGDSNFMPVIAGTKIISESLESVYQSLSQALNKKTSSRKKRKTGR